MYCQEIKVCRLFPSRMLQSNQTELYIIHMENCVINQNNFPSYTSNFLKLSVLLNQTEHVQLLIRIIRTFIIIKINDIKYVVSCKNSFYYFLNFLVCKLLTRTQSNIFLTVNHFAIEDLMEIYCVIKTLTTLKIVINSVHKLVLFYYLSFCQDHRRQQLS